MPCSAQKCVTEFIDTYHMHMTSREEYHVPAENKPIPCRSSIIPAQSRLSSYITSYIEFAHPKGDGESHPDGSHTSSLQHPVSDPRDRVLAVLLLVQIPVALAAIETRPWMEDKLEDASEGGYRQLLAYKHNPAFYCETRARLPHYYIPEEMSLFFMLGPTNPVEYSEDIDYSDSTIWDGYEKYKGRSCGIHGVWPPRGQERINFSNWETEVMKFEGDWRDCLEISRSW